MSPQDAGFRQGRRWSKETSTFPAAEDIFRQTLYGNNYFRKDFGKASTEYILAKVTATTRCLVEKPIAEYGRPGKLSACFRSNATLQRLGQSSGATATESNCLLALAEPELNHIASYAHEPVDHLVQVAAIDGIHIFCRSAIFQI